METRNEPLPVDEWRQVKYLTAAEIKLEAQRVRYAARHGARRHKRALAARET